MGFSLIGFYVIFLIGGHAAPVPVLCGISAAFLQYFMLVYFGWTAAEAVYLYRKLVKVLGANIARYVLKAALIVWCKYIITAVHVPSCFIAYTVDQEFLPLKYFRLGGRAMKIKQQKLKYVHPLHCGTVKQRNTFTVKISRSIPPVWFILKYITVNAVQII